MKILLLALIGFFFNTLIATIIGFVIHVLFLQILLLTGPLSSFLSAFVWSCFGASLMPALLLLGKRVNKWEAFALFGGTIFGVLMLVGVMVAILFGF